MDLDALRKKCTFYTVEEISTPKDGFVCMTDKWWALDSDGRVIIFDKYSPQCNSNKEITLTISKRMYSGDVVFIPSAFIEIDTRY